MSTKDDKADSQEILALDKTRVLREAEECFNTSRKVAPNQLISVLTRCVDLLHRGDTLTQKEATNLFFNVQKLFQYGEKNSVLRRLTYISIKALSKQAENVYVVQTILTRDVNSTTSDPAIRASALRALCQVSDNIGSIEQQIRQSLVDRHPVVASAAISFLLKVSQSNSEIVERCAEEIQEALNSDSPMVQYHALGLRYNLCRSDGPNLSRLISNCIQKGLKSPLAICLLIRMIVNHINDHYLEDSQCYSDYIRDQMNHGPEMVEFEAANALITLKSTISDTRREAVQHLKNFLTSSRSALKYAAVRILVDTMDSEERFWSVNRIGNVCKLHLLHKRYRPEDHIVGLLDFSESDARCARCSIIFESEDNCDQVKMEQFCLDTLRTDFALQIPTATAESPGQSKLHCVLSFIFHIVDKTYSKELYEDKIGTIELAPSKIDTKPFRCDFPLAIYLGR